MDTSTAATSTVCVVDDDASVRASLDALLRSVGFEVRLFPSAGKFLAEYRPDGPACLLLDLRMRGMSGLELQEELAVRRIRIPIIFLTAHGEVPAAVRALQNGAFDFLEKPCSHQALLDRVRQALDESERRHRAASLTQDISERLRQLTARERQVLDRLVEGERPVEIAARLGISRKTVDAHRANIMDKTGARSLADLVRFTIGCGELSVLPE